MVRRPNPRAPVRAQRHTLHPPVVRVTHWLNAVLMGVMVMSGWEIHNAYPVLPFAVPRVLTLGGWLGGATRWHFAAMYLLMLNGLVYLAYGILSGRFRRMLFPLTPGMIMADLRAAVTGRLSHGQQADYNALQKLLYLGVILAALLAVASGLAIWKPVQFGWLTWLMGDFDQARIVHFVAMVLIVAFALLHVAMALLVPRSLLAMLRGY